MKRLKRHREWMAETKENYSDKGENWYPWNFPN